MSDQCLRTEHVGALCAGATDDPRWAHVAACPRCRSLVAAYRGFVAGRPDLADPAAEAELGRRLAREIGGPPSSVRVLRRSRPYVRVSLALAAVLATAVIVVRWAPGPPATGIVVRGTEAPATPVLLTHAPQARPDGDLDLSWVPWPDAELYAVILFAGTLDEIARFTADADTILVVPAAIWQDAGGPDADLLWQVEALHEGGVVARSALTILPAP